MVSSYSFFAAAASVLAVSTNAMEITTENFSEMTAGKTVFIKFFAPWCGHCKAMAGDWEQLEKDFEGHAVALVGSVDCTTEDTLCEAFQVDGFPSLAWGEASATESYDGGRDYASLKAFADEHITKLVCSISNIDVCSDEEKAEITKVDGMTDDELKAVAAKIGDLAKVEEKKFQKYIFELQNQYEAESSQHNDRIQAIKDEHKFKYVQQIFAKRGIPNPLDEDQIEYEDDDDLSAGEL